MTRRWLDALFCRRPELRPARALLHPTWLGALAVLGLNDHLLKGAGVLPGGLTGKLSDFAGMIVAPALLAALLGVRSRRGLLHCHIAVGLVFALINLSPGCADAWSWLMGLVGFPWTITVDPTDLVALPALALGWRALVPTMQGAAAASSTWAPRSLRVAQSGAACLGALLCVATSDDDGGNFDGGEFDGGWDPGETTYPTFSADVYLHNSSPDREITVRVRELRDDVLIDCFDVEAGDPGVLFSEQLFGEGVTWAIPPGANVPARQQLGDARDCYAVLLASDSLPDQILFWRADDIRVTSVEGQHASPDAYLAGAVALTADSDGVVSIESAERDIVFPSRPAAPGAHMPVDDGLRLAWSTPPIGVHEITAIELGSDGCAAFTFDGGTTPRFYLCTPVTELPFAPLDRISITDHGDLVVLSRVVDPDDPESALAAQLAVSRGGQLPSIPGIDIAAKPIYTGELGPEPACGTVVRPQALRASFAGEIAELPIGGSVDFVDAAGTLTLHGVRAERRVILPTECAEGPDGLGDDLEVVYVWTAAETP